MIVIRDMAISTAVLCLFAAIIYIRFRLGEPQAVWLFGLFEPH